MTGERLKQLYFDWLCQLVEGEEQKELLAYLHEKEFTYSMPMDANRFEDGIDLRYRFAVDEGYRYGMVASCLDDKTCSMLEMMAALALKCEEHIAYDPELGDRTGKWFWNMVTSLGLGTTHNDDIISRFLNHDYAKNGKGGLFTVRNRKLDMRTADIWHQLCWYMEEFYERGTYDE